MKTKYFSHKLSFLLYLLVMIMFITSCEPIDGDPGLIVDQWGYRATEGNLRITFENNKNSYTSISNTHEFRYVLIPGAVNTKSAINYVDYEAVKKAFNIPD